MIYRINYGYRSLIDWSIVRSVQGNIGGKGLSTEPISFEDSAGRPKEYQGSRSTQIPGAKGIYYDVLRGGHLTPENWKATRKGKSGDMETYDTGGSSTPARRSVADKIATLGENPQQWLYLAAETMRGQSLISADVDDYSDEERNLVGAARTVTKGRWKNVEDVDFGLEKITLKNMKEEEESELFAEMIEGIGKRAWLMAFTENIRAGGKTRIAKLSKIFRKHFLDNIEEHGKKSHVRKGFGDKTEVNPTEGGQTFDEKIALGAGIEAPKDIVFGGDFKTQQKNYSNPIDLKFNQKIQVSEGGSEFDRMDITTSFYIDPKTGKSTGQHGTGTQALATDFNEGIQSIEDVESKIRTQQKAQVIRLNNLMDAIIAASAKRTGEKTKGPYGAAEGDYNLQKLRASLPSASKSVTSSGRGGKITSIAGFDMALLESVKDQVGDQTKTSLLEDIEWIMHHIGNMITADGGQASSYANTMSILINGVHGTLVLVYNVKANGKYEEYVEATIMEDVTPTEYLIQLANRYQGEVLFSEIAESANAGMAADGLSNVKAYGTLYQAVTMLAGASIHPRISMGEIIPAKFSQKLSRVVEAVFKNIGNEQFSKVKQQIRSEALTFSKQARKGGHVQEMKKWHEWASKIMLRAEHQPDFKNVKLGTDPFWYLWAAPYITGEFHQIGAGKQWGGGAHETLAGGGASAGNISY